MHFKPFSSKEKLLESCLTHKYTHFRECTVKLCRLWERLIGSVISWRGTRKCLIDYGLVRFRRDLEVRHGLCRNKIKINLTESHRHGKVLAVRNLYRNSIVALRYIKFLTLLTWAFQSHFSEGNPFVLCCVSFTRVLWPTLGGKIYKEVKSFDQLILVAIFMYW